MMLETYSKKELIKILKTYDQYVSVYKGYIDSNIPYPKRLIDFLQLDYPVIVGRESNKT